MTRKFQTYAEFWPHYLAEHARPGTRAWHFAGTALALALLAAAVVTLNPWLGLRRWSPVTPSPGSAIC